MASRYKKKMLISLIIRETQIKPTMRYYLTAVKMADIKKTRDKNHWQGHEENGIFLHCWRKYKLVKSLWKAI